MLGGIPKGSECVSGSSGGGSRVQKGVKFTPLATYRGETLHRSTGLPAKLCFLLTKFVQERAETSFFFSLMTESL